MTWNPLKSNAGADLGAQEVQPADTEVRIRLQGGADSLAGALAALGMSLVKQICPGPSGPQGAPLNLSCRGNDHHSLVLSWMETLLYLMNEQQVTLTDIEVQVGKMMSLKAQCHSQGLQGARLVMPRALEPSSARALQSEEGAWHTECTLLMGGSGAERQGLESTRDENEGAR
jgi:hypothetical protein